jgi:hypothetical protein
MYDVSMTSSPIVPRKKIKMQATIITPVKVIPLSADSMLRIARWENDT